MTLNDNLCLKKSIIINSLPCNDMFDYFLEVTQSEKCNGLTRFGQWETENVAGYMQISPCSIVIYFTFCLPLF